MAALTARGKALRRMSTHRGITEDPHGSNTDKRKDGIRAAQVALGSWLVGLPWCGVWVAAGLRAAKVAGVNYQLASVSQIEDLARRKAAPFWDWQPRSQWRKVLRGDLVILFGRGVHVEMVRSFKQVGGQVYVVTDGGNTSSGTGGSQSNGGGSYRRVRPLGDVYGFARVDFPGGAVKRRGDRLMMAVDASRTKVEDAPSAAQSRDMPVSDKILLHKLQGVDDPEAFELRDALKAL